MTSTAATLRSDPISISIIRHALLTPTRIDRTKGEFTGSVYTADGRRVELAERYSPIPGDPYKPSSALLEDAASRSTARYVEGAHLYLGHYIPHYGHFIAETMSTFWAFKFIRLGAPMFHVFNFGSGAPDFVRDFLSAFGLTREECIIVNDGPIIVEELIVPQRLLFLNVWVHRELLWVFTEARRRLIDESRVRPAHRLIYVSRSKVDTRRIANEEAVEDTFRSLGFEVVHPEELTLSQQIEAYYGARVLAGFSGSGLHNCVFMAPGGRVIELGDWRSPTKGLASQTLFESLVGQTNTFIPFVGGDAVDGRAAVDVPRLQSALPALASPLLT